MVHYLRCKKQYIGLIGETKRRLKDHFNEHRRPVGRPTPSSRPTAVSDHFLSDNRTDTTRTHAFLNQTLQPIGINKRKI